MVDTPIIETEVLEESVGLTPTALRALLIEAARLGASQALSDFNTYTLKEAATLLGITYNTLRKRLNEGKIKAVDGRISGRELRRYLIQ